MFTTAPALRLWHPQRQQFSPSTPQSHPESLTTREPSALTPFLFRGDTRKGEVQPGRALPARTEASTSQRRRPLTASLPAPAQPPEAAGQRGAPAATDLGSSPPLGFWLLARSAAELAFSPSQAQSTHMFFVFLTRFLKFTHFCTLELPSARVNHRDWQCPCSKNKHSALERRRAPLSSKEAYALRSATGFLGCLKLAHPLFHEAEVK